MERNEQFENAGFFFLMTDFRRCEEKKNNKIVRFIVRFSYFPKGEYSDKLYVCTNLATDIFFKIIIYMKTCYINTVMAISNVVYSYNVLQNHERTVAFVTVIWFSNIHNSSWFNHANILCSRTHHMTCTSTSLFVSTWKGNGNKIALAYSLV